MPLTDQHRFGMQLAHMSRGWRAELDRRPAGLGLSQARWLVLLHAWPEPPAQRELAQAVSGEGPARPVYRQPGKPGGPKLQHGPW